MGTGYTIECGNCDYRNTFHLGIGMCCPSIENLFFMVSEEEKMKIQDIIDRHPLANCNFYNVVCRCPACNDLSNQLYYDIYYLFEHFISDFSCLKCGTKLEIIMGKEDEDDDDFDYEDDDENENNDENDFSKDVDHEQTKTIEEDPDQIMGNTPCPSCGKLTLRIGEVLCWD